MNLEEEIINIKKRNIKVEIDKAFETSITRKITIIILTYIIVLLFSFYINKEGNIYLNSLIPVFVFFLSTLSLNIIKKIWVKHYKKKEVSL